MRWEVWASLVLVTAGLAGCLGSDDGDLGASDASDAAGGGAVAASAGSAAVVGVIDTGINPYHEVFRDDSELADQHPSTYIPGYPEDAKALNLTFDAANWTAAVRADCEDVWSQVEAGQLYWVPGTKIVGAISHRNYDAMDCSQAPGNVVHVPVLDTAGHGTMTASRATATTYGACQECRVVAVQGFTEASVAWTANHSDWIDVQSNSWGPLVPAWVPVDPGTSLINHPGFVETVEQAAQAHPAFWASGNGAMTRGGLVGHPTQLDPRLTPSVVMVGGHDSGYVNTWPGFPPHVVSDSCQSWAAHDDSTNESAATVGSGTSAATPYVAGKAAQLLLDARRMLSDADTGIENGTAAEGTPPANLSEGPLADGNLTKAELETLFQKTAQQRPEKERADGPRCDVINGLVVYSSTPVEWSQVPDSYPGYMHIGYGAVNNASTERARAVLNGTEVMPERSQASQFFAMDQDARERIYEVWSTQPTPEDAKGQSVHALD